MSLCQISAGSSKWCCMLAAIAIFLALSFTAVAQTTLTVAIVWGSEDPVSAGFHATAERFEELHPGVKIEFLPGTGMGDSPEELVTTKLLTLVAGGLAPDLSMVGGQSVPQYAHAGLLMPLQSYMRSDGVRERDFIPAAWQQTHWLGTPYAMTVQVDPNFALVWNKGLFSEAGLDAERGPETLSEYEMHFRRLTRVDADGRVVQIGHRLWDVYGGANTVYTWGWMFGGEFYDYENNVVTATNPHVVEALEFVRDYYERYALTLGPNIAFPQGGEAMRLAVSANTRTWREQYPEISLGAGFEPYKEGSGSPNPSWIGGWAMGILRDAPSPDLAWQFLHYLTATTEGTDVFASASGWIPAYLNTPAHRASLRDPIMSVYLEIAQNARYMRPGMPVIADYSRYLEEAFNDIMAGSKQPLQALEFVQRQVQSKLDEALSR